MIIDFNKPQYSYIDLISDANALAQTYSNIMQNVTIGKSHDNRDIVMLKLGTGKKYILFCAGVHGRETINPIILLKIAEYYAKIYEEFYKVKEKFENFLKNPAGDFEKQYNRMIFGKCVYELLRTYTILVSCKINCPNMIKKK
ncbi:MAG TPA: M14 family zinc carboxypeptidase [Mobilitalea sp.]|nr:M14 family zinc carboxypeptidase [Mobilitalea sp.]